MPKERVTILGGGLSGLTTAYHLSAPEQQGHYDVTVYQLGWRLGGKCATGRNESEGDRIQEHGLHVFMGQYDNAFHMVQALYAEAAHPPFADWRKGFTEQPSCTLMEEVAGKWVPWPIHLPVFPGTPGSGDPPRIWERMIYMLEWIEGEILHHLFSGGFWRSIFGAPSANGKHPVSVHVRRAKAAVHALHPDPAQHKQEDHHRLAGILHGLRGWIEPRVRNESKTKTVLRRLWIIIDLMLANAIGGLRDGLLLDPKRNLERVNALDYKAWLRSHGATERTVESAIVRSLYDLIFAYPLGDWKGDGNTEAGTMFVSLTNTALYRGSILWKFNTATGDLVMGPLYEVMRQRGVKFEFFSRVDELVPSEDGNWIKRVEIGRQVELAVETYEPMRTLPSGMRVWPDQPLYQQIRDGDALKNANVDLESHWTTWKDRGKPLTLEMGRDYDWLVLAIPPAAQPTICQRLIAQSPAWREMVENVQTVATQSFQTWMTATEAELGWTQPSVTGGYDVTPLNTWADISEVLGSETWPKDSSVVSEQIACGPLPCPAFPPPRSDTGYPASVASEVMATAENFLADKAWVFWPGRFGQKQPPRAGTIRSAYNRANIDPSERYTLTVAGSTKYRMGAADSGYLNLFLSGDWIQNGQNLGSFEATTVSGMLTSRALSGLPEKIMRSSAAVLAGRRKGTSGPPVRPRFVEHGGLATFPGPIQFTDVAMWAFLLDADRAKLEAFCRHTFDAPSGGAVRVVPLTSHMMMTVTNIARGVFTDAEYMGWSGERELTFWIPAVRCEERNGRLRAVSLDFVMPYLVLDNPVAIASGREIFGYWKQRGWLTLPDDAGNKSGDFLVDLFSSAVFGKNTEEGRNRLLTLSRVGERQSPTLARIKTFDHAARALHSHLTPSIEKYSAGLGFTLETLAEVLTGHVPQLFLKQFRDISDGRNACYQAATEAIGHVTRFRALPHFVEYDMQLSPLASSPVAADFGLKPSQRLLGVKLLFDMGVSPGRTLWEA